MKKQFKVAIFLPKHVPTSSGTFLFPSWQVSTDSFMNIPWHVGGGDENVKAGASVSVTRLWNDFMINPMIPYVSSHTSDKFPATPTYRTTTQWMCPFIANARMRYPRFFDSIWIKELLSTHYITYASLHLQSIALLWFKWIVSTAITLDDKLHWFCFHYDSL